VNAEAPKENGSEKPTSLSPSSTAERSRLGRTLFTAGVFALLAMLFVPLPANQGGGYRLIFSGKNTSIAFFQLLLNVGFAALLGAILATITPKIVRAVRKLPRWAGEGIVVIALLSIGALEWRNFTEAAAIRARSDEEYAEELLRWERFPAVSRPAPTAQFYFRNAAQNWRLALRFDEATRVENRIKEIARERAQEKMPDPFADPNFGLPKSSPPANRPP
jgi:hypothetical protein